MPTPNPIPPQFLPAILCEKLCARFGDKVAVDQLSLEVPAGAVCALLGPNGAGKSTSVKMMTGLLRPTSGTASIAGFDVTADPIEVKRRIGVLPEHLGLFDALTVQEHLHMTGPIYGLTRTETRDRSAQLIRVLGLEDTRDTYASRCSHGTRKKTALAMALLPNPRVLFLDEPFEGIDPVTSKSIRDMIAMLASRGTTVFLTSHILPIVEKIATQAVMILDGRIVWNAPAAGMAGRLEEFYFDLVDPPPPEDLPWLGPAHF